MGWHLVARVPLHFVVIPEEEIVSARQRCGMRLETWRQERAFGLTRKVYAKRAAIRGQRPAPAVVRAFQWNDWPEQ